MATVIGESGAWREIAEQLERWGFHIQQPADVNRLLSRLRDNFQPSVELKKSETTQCVLAKEQSIAALQAERGIWNSFVNWFRIRECKNAILHLRSEERQYIAELLEDIQRVDALQKSGKMAGARAELNVIEHLSNLSDGYTVFSDLRLTADRYIRFNGVPLQSAQIDHLVLSSAGVFVIETKQWSRRFVESREYHNPFDQIQRAAYLCYDRLRTEFGKIRIRSIIACAGQLPSVPEDSRVKVLAVSDLVGYISWFRQTEIAPERISQIQRYLERFRAT